MSSRLRDPNRIGDGFVGARLTRTREARLMSQAALAEATQLSATSISNYENGRQSPRPLVVDRLADALRVPVSQFFRPEAQPHPAPFLMRSMAAATKRAQDAGRARAEWLRELVAYLSPLIPMPDLDVPTIWSGEDPTTLTFEDVEEMAIDLRQHWGMGDGPIDNMTALLESKGVVVSCFALNANKLDAFSKWTDEAPLVVENTEARWNAVRMRFDLGHELFHLVAHRNVPASLANQPAVHKLMERQAHRFSGAFIFPETSFANEVYSVSMEELVPVKKRWKLAGAAIIARARQLGMISDDQYTRAFKRLSAQGYRRAEPLDDELKPEMPTLLAERVKALVETKRLTGADFEVQLGLGKTEIEVLSGLKPGWLSRTTDNVVELRR